LVSRFLAAAASKSIGMTRNEVFMGRAFYF
jgi:hypothetical protein